ncbi:UV DNA damage repair endonuclease UvsE [Aneurinibacillus tyrosinisolvens]|uniref:UV DNA damage repair endonuclease UvsE n=1 Tax=Aneurinibacillus tyrosinisolvens TaxID=1443435 RepID=UPI00063EDD35|nr:UV DNA damage repair endonuclease UvsE [Aneurinibacillus tyrosinisolvens]
MEVHLGHVAMSVHVANASPSRTMTAKRFATIADREAGLRKLEHLAEQNIESCIRLLYHNRAHDIKFFRLSSRLIPLVGHELTEGWDYMKPLADAFAKLGTVIKDDNVRADFHPDHFVVLNSPRRPVFETSLAVLRHHIRMLEAMGIPPRHRCVLHVGGAYNNKEKAIQRFIDNWGEVPEEIRSCLMLENDDKIFTAEDTLQLSESLKIPMVLDIHHHRCNHQGEEDDILHLLPRIVERWSSSPLPMKMHISSPRGPEDKRSHADYINPDDLFPFLHKLARYTPRVDVMVEAKKKDDAVLRLAQWVKEEGETNGVRFINGGSFEIHPK